MRLSNKSNRFIHILILFLVWQVTYYFYQNPALLPSPKNALTSLYIRLFEYYFWQALLASMKNLIIAFAGGMCILLSLCFLSMVSIFKNFLKTVVSVFGSMPAFAILPVLLIFFGINLTTMIMLMIFSMLWINLSNALLAMEQVHTKWSSQCENLKLPMTTRFFQVYFPAMLPYLLNIAKNAWVLCWRTLLALEVAVGSFGTGKGIGIMMVMDKVTFNISDLYGMLVLIALIGYVIGNIFDKAINKIKWKDTQ